MPGESPLGWLELDLDAELHYAPGLLVLTPNRLFEVPGRSGRRWLLAAGGSRLARAEGPRASRPTGTTGPRQGLGTLAIHGRPFAFAHRLAHCFDRLRSGKSSGTAEGHAPPTVACPSCGTILAAGQETCPDCGSINNKPGLGALYRVASFAKPHKWVILLAFLLMIGSTGLTLVPPYLTSLLMDNVLIPAAKCGARQ